MLEKEIEGIIYVVVAKKLWERIWKVLERTEKNGKGK